MTKFVFQNIEFMDQIQFIDYNETIGIGDLQFVNTNNVDQYRFYRRRDDWDECYMVEFYSDSIDYHFYWGYKESERGMIDVVTLLSPQDPEIEWKRVKIPFLAYNLPQIVESIEIEITGYEI